MKGNFFHEFVVMRNSEKTDKLCISSVNSLSFFWNRSKNTFRRDLNFEEITYPSSLFMAFLASVLVFPCCRSNLSS